jgi:LysM repeat protein
MYWSITPKKLLAIIAIAIIMLFQGCTTVRQPTYPSSYYHTHIVKPDESLHRIAEAYEYDYREIARINNLSPPDYSVYPGQTLRIPKGITSGAYIQSRPSMKSQLLKERRKKSRYPYTPPKKNYHTVRRGETLSKIAKRYGQSYRQIADWNNLSSPYNLSIGQSLRVKKPKRKTKKRIAPTRKTFPTKRTSTVSHVVRRGDTLFGIATRYGYTVSEVARWNGLEPPYNLSTGRRLRVAPIAGSTSKKRWKKPTVSTTVSTSKKRWKKPTVSTTVSTSKKRWKKPVKQQSTGKSGGYHTVAFGDTLYSLSKHYRRDVAEIAIWNNLKPPYTLSKGQRLRVSSTRKIQRRQKQVVTQMRHNTGYHKIARGDTLFSIAKSYGYNVSSVAAWNNLHPPYNLSVGQKLRIYPPSGAKLGYRNLATKKRATKKRASRKSSTRTTSSRKSSTRTTSSRKSSSHTVVGGDTLYNIAKRYGKTVSQLANWNKLSPPYNLPMGQRLRIYSSSSGSHKSRRSSSSRKSRRSSSSRKSRSYHRAKHGETLWSIAAKYGISAYKLSEWNGIGEPHTIYPGQQLRLKP